MNYPRPPSATNNGARHASKPEPDELPPHSESAETGLLACVLLTPERLDEIRQVVDSSMFFDLAHANLFRTFLKCQSEGKLITLPVLAELLADQDWFVNRGGASWLASILEYEASSANWPVHAREIKEKAARRTLLRVSRQISTWATNPEIKIDSIARDLAPALEGLALFASDESDELSNRLYTHQRKPFEAPPLFYLSNIPICTPGNLTTIVAAIKTGKSAAIGAMIASTMCEDLDCLGFRSSNDGPHAVLHFDTEQSDWDHWCQCERIRKRAGLSEIPNWFRSYRMAGLRPCDILRMTHQAIRDAQRDFGGIHSIFIDGVADLVNDVNDSAEANSTVAKLHGMAIDLHASIVLVIHRNPGTDKSRGHLGSQLERKAESNLVIEKEDGVSVLWSEKQRGAPIPKNHGPRFAWSDEVGMHLSVSTAAESRFAEERQELQEVVSEAFHNKAHMRFTELRSMVMEVMTVKEKQAQRNIKKMQDYGLIRKNIIGSYERAA